MSSTYEWVPVDHFQPSEWDDLVEQANEGTIFHQRRFLAYHTVGKFTDCSLALTKRGNLFGALTAAIRERKSESGTLQPWLVSHPGASYGGILTKKILNFDEAMEIGSRLLEKAKELGFAGVDFTLPPMAYHAILTDVWNFTLLQLGFQYRKRDYSQLVPLWVDNLAERYDNKTRGAMRHAVKQGVTIREVELSETNWDIFYPMLVKNREKYHVTPAHNREDLSALVRQIPEKLHLYFAFDADDNIVAGTLIFIVNQRIHMTFYITHLREREELKAVILLNDFSIRQAKAAGAKWLDFGISTVDGVPGPGLIRFKENFGAVGCWRDVYYKVLGSGY